MSLEVVNVVGRHILNVVVKSQQAVHEASQLAGLNHLIKPLFSILPREHDFPSVQLTETFWSFGPEVGVPLQLCLGLLLLLFQLPLSRVVLLEFILELLVDQSHLI